MSFSMPIPSGLGHTQTRALVDEGFVHLPGLIPKALIDRALGAINRSLGHEGLPKDQLPSFRARTYTPELTGSDAIRNLYTASPLTTMAESAIGVGKVKTPSEGQVALRFPSPATAGAPVPHIDGLYDPHNGVAAGTLYHFTALAAVFLSDVTEPDRGNFSVWPRSHVALESLVRKRGMDAFKDGFPAIDLGPPQQVIARAGDAMLAHYQLAHGIAPNFGPHIRYAVFFRLFNVDHHPDGRALGDLWADWEGV